MKGNTKQNAANYNKNNCKDCSQCNLISFNQALIILPFFNYHLFIYNAENKMKHIESHPVIKEKL